MISDQGLKNLPPDCMTDWEPEVSHELLYWIVFFSLCPLVEKGAYKNLFFFPFPLRIAKFIKFLLDQFVLRLLLLTE